MAPPRDAILPVKVLFTTFTTPLLLAIVSAPPRWLFPIDTWFLKNSTSQKVVWATEDMVETMTAEESCEFTNFKFLNRILDMAPLISTKGPTPKNEHVSIQRMSTVLAILTGSSSVLRRVNPPQKMISFLPDSIIVLKSSKDCTSTHSFPVGIVLNKHKPPESVPPTLPPTGSILPVVSVVLRVGIIVGGLNVVMGPGVDWIVGFTVAVLGVGKPVGFFNVGGAVITSTGLLVIATIGGLVNFVVGLIEGLLVGICVGAFVGIGVGFNVGFTVGLGVIRMVGKGVGGALSNTTHDSFAKS